MARRISARRRRDEEFRAFVAERRPALVRAATLLTSGDEHLAEDLVQVTLTRVYLKWHRVRDMERPHAYANRVLINAFIDETRRPVQRREQVHEVVPEPRPEGGGSLEDRDEILQALDTLPPGMRSAVVLRHWLQFDVGETAEALDCSEGTVKSQTARGLDRLREQLVTTGSAAPSETGSPATSADASASSAEGPTRSAS